MHDQTQPIIYHHGRRIVKLNCASDLRENLLQQFFLRGGQAGRESDVDFDD